MVEVGAAVALLLATTAACGSGGEDRTATSGVSDSRTEPPAERADLEAVGLAGPRRDGSSPFTVGSAPEGWALMSVGAGEDRQESGSDTMDGDRPYTVLAREGDEESAGIRVTLADLEGGPDEIERANQGFRTAAFETFEVDGRAANYWSGEVGADSGGWTDADAELILEVEDHGALKVEGAGSKAELIAIAEAAALPADPAEPPSVLDPPDGFTVVGAVDGDVVVATRGSMTTDPQRAGTAAAHTARWGRADADGQTVLSVSTLPGGTADLAALARPRPLQPQGHSAPVARTTVGGIAAVEIGLDGGTGWQERVLVAGTSWGDILLIRAAGEPGVSFDELEAMAAAVQEADAAAWDELVASASAG